MTASLRHTFRIVKGAPLTVLIAMLQLGGECGLAELCDLTTYTDKTVDRALGVLSDAGLITRTHYHRGLKLTQHGFQLPFILGGELLTSDNLRSLAPGNIGEFPTSEKFLSTTATESLTALEPNTNQDLETAVEAAGKNSEVVAALKAAGIGNPVRDELASDPYLTPEYITGMAAYTRSEGKSSGMLVTRLRSHDHLPEEWLVICSGCGKRPGRYNGECGECYYGGFVSQ